MSARPKRTASSRIAIDDRGDVTRDGFRIYVGDRVVVDGISYLVVEHPAGELAIEVRGALGVVFQPLRQLAARGRKP